MAASTNTSSASSLPLKGKLRGEFFDAAMRRQPAGPNARGSTRVPPVAARDDGRFGRGAGRETARPVSREKTGRCRGCNNGQKCAKSLRHKAHSRHEVFRSVWKGVRIPYAIIFQSDFRCKCVRTLSHALHCISFNPCKCAPFTAIFARTCTLSVHDECGGMIEQKISTRFDTLICFR